MTTLEQFLSSSQSDAKRSLQDVVDRETPRPTTQQLYALEEKLRRARLDQRPAVVWVKSLREKDGQQIQSRIQALGQAK